MEAGLGGEQLLAVVRSIENDNPPAPEKQVSKGALRMRRLRERQAAAVTASVTCDVSGDVTCDATGDASGGVAPAPDKSPPHPQKLTPTPCVQDTPTHESEPDGSAVGRLHIALITLDGLVAALRYRRWKLMTPPPEVPEDVWEAFVDYRKQKRQTLTIGAYRPLVKRLAEFRGHPEWPPGRIVEEIMERGWLTFKPHWIERKTDKRNGQRDHDPADGFGNSMAAAAARYIARENGGS
jgi:hypothetical protein